MASVSCPRCARMIPLEPGEVDITLQCAACERVFRVVKGHQGQRPPKVRRGTGHDHSAPTEDYTPTEVEEGAAPVRRNALPSLIPEPEESPRPKVGAVAFGCAALAAALLLAVALALSLGTSPGVAPPVRPTAVQPAKGQAPAPRAAVGDPWPECAVVRQWWSEHASDPASIEVVRWIDRKPMLDPGHFIVKVRYRGTNNVGGRQVEVREFSVHGDKLYWSQPVPE